MKMMKVLSTPLPSPEEVLVHKFVDSCAFKSTISCVGGNSRFLSIFQVFFWVDYLVYLLRASIHLVQLLE